METISLILFVIKISIISGVVLILPAMGEVMAELTGMYNMGLEGIMAMGAVVAVVRSSTNRMVR